MKSATCVEKMDSVFLSKRISRASIHEEVDYMQQKIELYRLTNRMREMAEALESHASELQEEVKGGRDTDK